MVFHQSEPDPAGDAAIFEILLPYGHIPLDSMDASPLLQWTFSSLGCPELDLPQIIDLAQRHKIKNLELRTIEQRLDLPLLFMERFGEPPRLKDFLDAAGIRVMALDTSLALVGNSDNQRAEMLRFLPWAEALGTRYLRVFDGGSFAPRLAPQDLVAALDTIRWWRKQRAANGWVADIMVETHDCLTTHEAMLQLQSELEIPVPILWDTHHTWKLGAESPRNTWEAIKDHVVHVHVKDSISRHSGHHPYTYVLPGEGEFDFAGTLEMLRAEAFKGFVSLEWERQWHPYLPALDKALAKIKPMR